jgi:hypothetical protein
MTKTLIIVFLSLYSLNSTAKEITSTIAYGIGERNTTVDWNIAGIVDGRYLNPTSELTWKNIKSNQLLLSGIWTEGDYFLQVSSEYGKVYSGENQDSDWKIKEDNTIEEFSRSINNSGKGYMADLEINYGKSHIISPKLKVNAGLGYSHHRQHLIMYEGFQVIPLTGPFENLNSIYEANWSGPQVSVGIDYKDYDNVYLINYTHQDIDLNGHTYWNLRDLRMTQKGEGSGKKISLGYEHAVSNFSSFSLIFNRYKYLAKGIHTYHFQSGDAPVELNRVNWQADDVKLIYRSLF